MRFDPAEPLEVVAARIGATELGALLAAAEESTLDAHGPLVSYARNIFIPLSELCRNVCHYCTYAKVPRDLTGPYMTLDQVRAVAEKGREAGCTEALFTLGDKPEERFRKAREALAAMGFATTLEYVRAAAAMVHAETGLLPHLNPGILQDEDYSALRPVAASMGLMLETSAVRLSAKGGPHHGSPDKDPALRLAAIEAAGRASIPFTTGLLIGIGESRRERLDALVKIRDIHKRYRHIQEVIIQNFVPKPGTRMSHHPALPLEEQLWTIAAARLILGGEMVIQAPPNLRPGALAALLRAGVSDWGGVSPVTPDHINPEAPWPHLDQLAEESLKAGRLLRERLAIGPAFAREPERWLDQGLRRDVRRSVDARGLVMGDGWRAGSGDAPPPPASPATIGRSSAISAILRRSEGGRAPDAAEIVQLFGAEGADEAAVIGHADALRRATCGEAVTFVVNRNINYTNICQYRCGFCAFSKGGTRDLRGPAYQIGPEEIGRRAAEALARGATEVCLQGGIHPHYDGNTYLGVVDAVKGAAPGIHIHAFSPLEVMHGAHTLREPLDHYLARLRDAGLASLPGTAAEILHDDVRDVICPDKLTSAEWLEVMRAAHRVGLRSTATIMFGHVDAYRHWAHHLIAIRELQQESGGFTEFVPLPFVHMEAPLWRKGLSRSGPSFREAILMHSIARIALAGTIDNIQASWVKLGPGGAARALEAGANDLGGVLMDESITRAAGGRNGQCLDQDAMRDIAHRLGRPARQRTTLYAPAPILETT